LRQSFKDSGLSSSSSTNQHWVVLRSSRQDLNDAANLGVALLLYRYREGDANMRSVWICSRNDAIGNLAVGLAAIGVFGTASAWPDLAVAMVMAVLALTGAYSVGRQARTELAAA
jgi:Co/Zn/Cd efflux system component